MRARVVVAERDRGRRALPSGSSLTNRRPPPCDHSYSPAPEEDPSTPHPIRARLAQIGRRVEEADLHGEALPAHSPCSPAAGTRAPESPRSLPLRRSSAAPRLPARSADRRADTPSCPSLPAPAAVRGRTVPPAPATDRARRTGTRERRSWRPPRVPGAWRCPASSSLPDRASRAPAAVRSCGCPALLLRSRRSRHT